MKYRLEFIQAAYLDIQEAWLWYEEQKVGLGEEFLLSLEASFNQIQRNPLLYQIAFSKVRVALLRRFPYRIVYTLADSTIGVVGVLHTSRDPSIWNERIRN